MVEVERRAQSIFFQALEKRADERAAFLDEVCKGEAELRAKVERLLSSKAELGEIKNLQVDTSNEVIANYRLTERIGEGGFGEVFAADQTFPVKRRVALKLLKRGMDSVRVIARFDTERQALAILDHPNIAKIYDAGITESGRPYFAMELVQGSSITEYCNREKSSIRQRVELFLDVCSAIQHAHQKGIIHRDLKPTNILVSTQHEKPVIKVIDFGIAKAVGEHFDATGEHTAQHELLGTPSYMSPEQAFEENNSVDTRSDVYSLGIVLYELLTNSTPFDTPSFRNAPLAEARRIIREFEPSRPSARLATCPELQSISAQRSASPVLLATQIAGELDWIVLKALEKDRNRRYDSVGSLSQDLKSYLNDDPVLACPPSKVYQFRKFSRRHRRWIARIAIMAVLIPVVVALFVRSSFETIRSEARASKLLAELLAAKNEASANQYLDALTQLGQADQLLRGFVGGKTQKVLEQCIPETLELRNSIDDPQRRNEIDFGIRSIWLKSHTTFDLREAPPIPFASSLKLASGAIALHPNGHYVAIAGVTKPYLVERTALASNLRADTNLELRASDIAYDSKITFSCSGQWIVIASSCGEVSLWQLHASICAGKWQTVKDDQVLDLAFTSDEQSLLVLGVASGIHRLRLPKLIEEEKPLSTTEYLTEKTVSAAFSPDARQVALADSDGAITVYGNSGVQLKLVLPSQANYQLSWSRDSNYIAASTIDRVILIPTDHHSLPREFHRVRTPNPHRAIFSPDGRFLISESIVWDIDSGHPVVSASQLPIGISADGTTIAGIGTGISFGSISYPTISHDCYGHKSAVVQCCWSADSQRFATIDNNYIVCVWQADQGKLLYRFALPQGDIEFYPDNGGIALDTHGRHLCYMYRQRDRLGGAYLVDIENRKHSRLLPLPISGYYRTAYVPENHEFLGVCEQLQPDNSVNTTTLRVALDGNVKPGTVIRTAHAGEYKFLDQKISNDGRFYAWLGPRRPVESRRIEILETTNSDSGPLYRRALGKQPDGTEPTVRLSPDLSDLWHLYVDYSERVRVFENRAQRVSVNGLIASSSDQRWMICSPGNVFRPTPRTSTVNLHRFGDVTPWIGLHRDGANVEMHNGDAYFSPDGKWVAWSKDVGGQLTVVDLTALEQGVEQLFK